MISLFTNEEFIKAAPSDKLLCECLYCHKNFHLTKHRIQAAINPNVHDKGDFCSNTCARLYERINNKKQVICLNCGAKFIKELYQATKSPRHFCSQSCSATYNNTHKTTGNRRSKLEFYLEQELSALYPILEIHYNQKDAINSELDIYIPLLKLAFELNGIFHYEPIYGTTKLSQIQNNDQRKFQACIERGIELCIVDASGLKYFKPERARKFLDIVINIINIKLSKNN